ncbi:hypothetical protein B0H14DRAFT_3142991, partial [Mycena olivaceomarginata]
MYGFVLGQNLILGQQNATFHQPDLNSPIARKHIAAQDVQLGSKHVQQAWAWIDSGKLRGADNLYVDGMHTGSCPAGAPGPADGGLYTYNQGVMIAGLGAYYNATRQPHHRGGTHPRLDFLPRVLHQWGVLQKHCDGPAVWGTLNNVRNGDCFEGSRRDPNKEVFKGLFMKHMMYYLEWTNDATNVRFGNTATTSGHNTPPSTYRRQTRMAKSVACGGLQTRAVRRRTAIRRSLGSTPFSQRRHEYIDPALQIPFHLHV